MNALVSVIIPVYNVEKYLKRGIESILNQTYKNLQIIIVDDQSPDNCPQMCDEYARQDDRVMVIHKENGGLSSARNEGMKHVCGEYIVFFDSDDYMSSTAIERMMRMCKDNNCEISIIKTEYIPDEMNDEIKDSEAEKIYVFNTKDAIEQTLYQKMYSCTAWGKLYHKNVLDGLEFPPGKIAEDLAVSHTIFHRAKKVAYSNQIGYYYRQNPTSIMHTFREARMSALDFAREIEGFCKVNYPTILKAAELRTFNIAIHLLLQLPQQGELRDKYLDILWREIIRTRVSVLFNPKVRFREKAAAGLSFFGENTLKKAWGSRLAIKQKNT